MGRAPPAAVVFGGGGEGAGRKLAGWGGSGADSKEGCWRHLAAISAHRSGRDGNPSKLLGKVPPGYVGY